MNRRIEMADGAISQAVREPVVFLARDIGARSQ